MDGVEFIKTGEQVLAVIIKANVNPDKTTFFTPDYFTQQGGFVVYPKEGHIPAHDHKFIPRSLSGTSETLFVRKGHTIVHLYDSERKFVTERELAAGDILMLVSGGHGFSMLEDTVFFEIKQGPYTGMDEKERFE